MGNEPPIVAALNAVLAERVRQDAKFGVATLRGYAVARWLAVLAEEVGELAAEIAVRETNEDWRLMLEYLQRAGEHARVALDTEDPKEEVFAGYRGELVQVAAVAIAMLEAEQAADGPDSTGPDAAGPVGLRP